MSAQRHEQQADEHRTDEPAARYAIAWSAKRFAHELKALRSSRRSVKKNNSTPEIPSVPVEH
jgi:hypothetical protein